MPACWNFKKQANKKKESSLHHVSYRDNAKPQPITHKKMTCVLFSPLPFIVLWTTRDSDGPFNSHDALQRTKLLLRFWNDDNRTMNAQIWPADWHTRQTEGCVGLRRPIEEVLYGVPSPTCSVSSFNFNNRILSLFFFFSCQILSSASPPFFFFF